jgi:phenylalanyl-tRNA synthetase beta chain
MRVPLSWIRDFTPAAAPVDELAAALNQLGLEVEAIEQPGRELRGVVVARVLDVVAHPDADKLTLVDVDYGSGTTRVVCGAPNVVPGMVVPYAPAGSTLPNGLRLARRTIRGVTSDGMLCSPAELGLSDDHSGILGLDDANETGTEVRDVLGLDDVVFELSVTPNRPDAMCIVGVARELAAHFGWPLAIPAARAPTDETRRGDVSVVIEAPERCPRYVARVAGVAMGPSPLWMQRRLLMAGMRPISNVVDVTNYVLLERNQPLHAFDLSRLAGRGIVVRLADSGERVTTLDGVERELTPDDLLICDAERAPQAIAGIMGGGTSEVADDTAEILLEAAYFERMGIARTARRLKLRSEASARFERGIDPVAVAEHAARAVGLLADIAAARVAPEVVDEYPRPVSPLTIRLRTSKVNRVLGTALTRAEVLDALRPLGIAVTGKRDELVATAPTFRPDLEREIDLVEEVARRVGFDTIGRAVARPADGIGALTRAQRERRLVADGLVGTGCSEAVTIPLVSPLLLARAGLEVGVEVANPLRSEESALRPALLPGLAAAAGYNASHGNGDVALFELGRVFGAPAKGDLLPVERDHVAAILTGRWRRRPLEDDRPVDAYDAADLARAVADALELADVELVPGAGSGYRTGRAASVVVDGRPAGHVGEVAPGLLEAVALPPPVVAFEADLDQLLGARRRDRAYCEVSPFPPSNIDLAFVVDEAITSAAIAATLREAVGDVLEDMRVFDEFRADTLGANRKSLAFALRFRAPDRTLTDDEVGALRGRAIDAVSQAHRAQLRG